MSTLRQPGPPFKKAEAMITCVVSVPEKKVEYLKLLIDNYATAPTLPPELVELLLNFKQQLPS